MLRYKWLLSIAGALLFSAGWYNDVTGLPLLVALVPLLLISRSYDSSRRSFWKMAGWVALTFGLWNVACAWWVWYAAEIGTIASTIIQILLFGGVFMIYHCVSKRAKPSIAYIILVSGWIAAEYLYLTGEISFPWLLLGNGFAKATWAVQWYEYTGVFGGTLWVLIVNLLIFHATINRSLNRFIVALAFIVVPMAVSLTMFLTYGEPEGEEVKVAVVQPNIDPYEEKFTLSQEEQNANLLELASLAPADVDIIVMPETAIDDYVWEDEVWASPSMAQMRDFMRANYPNAQLVAGVSTYKRYLKGAGKTTTARPSGQDWYDVYNSAVAIDTSAVAPIYHKAKLVIGPEKMPYMNILEPVMKLFMVDLGGISGQLGIDDSKLVIRHLTDNGTEIAYASPICYESVYGEHFATFTERGAELMLIITNDGWWHNTPGHKQHFSFARLRAIESRRFIARSANTGISGFITPRGDVRETLGWEERGTLVDTLRLNDEVTFYAMSGDYIARICNWVFLAGVLYYIAGYLVNRRRRYTWKNK
jgi:apolipoprotein N-acyltransferase